MKAAEIDQTIYNEQAILRILGFHEKEGRFLLYGKEIPNLKAAEENVGQGTYGIQSGLVNKDIYKNNIELLAYYRYTKTRFFVLIARFTSHLNVQSRKLIIS